MVVGQFEIVIAIQFQSERCDVSHNHVGKFS